MYPCALSVLVSLLCLFPWNILDSEDSLKTYPRGHNPVLRWAIMSVLRFYWSLLRMRYNKKLLFLNCSQGIFHTFAEIWKCKRKTQKLISQCCLITPSYSCYCCGLAYIQNLFFCFSLYSGNSFFILFNFRNSIGLVAGGNIVYVAWCL